MAMKLSVISLLALCCLVFVSSYFAVIYPIGDFFTSVSNIFILVFVIPLIHSLIKWLGWKKGISVFLLLGGISLAVEMFAIVTGVPYGNFAYSSTLGFHLFNVPISVPLAYLPILIGAFTVSNHLLKLPTRLYHTLVSALLNTAIDFVIDPAAVNAAFWFWPEGGFYYGVPLINFGGWLFTGFLYSQILYSVVQTDIALLEVPIDASYSLLLILSFWIGYTLWNNLIIPVLVGFVILSLLIFLILQCARDSTS
jgi:putative membrane protein